MIFIVRKEAEKQMREWVSMFLEEIDRIESFFIAKMNEYRDQFEVLKDR